MMMEEINSKLWADEILKQIIARFRFAQLCYKEEPQELYPSVEKHKYFAFRVPNIEEAQNDKDQLADFASYPAKGMVSSIETDIMNFLVTNFFGEDYNAESPVFSYIDDLFTALYGKKVAFYGMDDIRVQAAYDVDYMAYSIVGDWKYTIGIIN